MKIFSLLLLTLLLCVSSQADTSDIKKVSDITKEDQENTNLRINAIKQFYVGFGPGFSSGLNGESGGFDISAGYYYGLDDQFGLSLSGEFYKGRSGDDSSLLNVSVGANYYLTTLKHSPFIGAGFGYGTAEANDDDKIDLSDAHGWSGQITAGYKMFRTTNVNLAVMARYTTIFDKVDEVDKATGESSDKMPGLFSINVAVFY